MRQSVRCVALGVLSAVALVGAALPASAGLLDGGWGCGCGGPAYYVVPDYIAPAYAAPIPALIYPQVQVVVATARRLCAALRLRSALCLRRPVATATTARAAITDARTARGLEKPPEVPAVGAGRPCRAGSLRNRTLVAR